MKIFPSLAILHVVFVCTVCDYRDYYQHSVNTYRQGVATLDTSAIYDGVFKPENIAIHLAQNVVNFLASTLAWGFLLHLYVKRYNNTESRDMIARMLRHLAEAFEGLE